MISKLTMMHAVLAVGACGSVYLAVREVQRRYISQWRLLAPPILGLGVALGLAVIQIAARQPAWPFIVVLLAGLAAGGVRGTLMRIGHDMYRPIVAVSRPAKLVGGRLASRLGFGSLAVLCRSNRSRRRSL